MSYQFSAKNVTCSTTPWECSSWRSAVETLSRADNADKVTFAFYAIPQQ
jgi:hypothetical protein